MADPKNVRTVSNSEIKSTPGAWKPRPDMSHNHTSKSNKGEGGMAWSTKKSTSGKSGKMRGY